MKFRTHYELEGKHAFLSPSKYSWINYTDERLAEVYKNQQMIQRGTELHRIAKDLITNEIRLPRTKQTLNMYVNDAIGYGMSPEVILKPLPFSDNAYGTADSISYSDKNKFLRIHDLKTGSSPASMDQLKIYAAFFCLEYGDEIGIKNDPSKIDIELRIYQSDNVVTHLPDPDEIKDIMDRTIAGNDIIEHLKSMEVD